MKSQTRSAGQRGASLVEYTLLLGIVATVSISAIRTIGSSMAGTADPCNPGILVKIAKALGDPASGQLSCPPQDTKE